MLDAWFDWLTDLSFDHTGAAVLLALATGVAAGGVGCAVAAAALWGSR
jgi:hypothetical protein